MITFILSVALVLLLKGWAWRSRPPFLLLKQTTTTMIKRLVIILFILGLALTATSQPWRSYNIRNDSIYFVWNGDTMAFYNYTDSSVMTGNNDLEIRYDMTGVQIQPSRIFHVRGDFLNQYLDLGNDTLPQQIIINDTTLVTGNRYLGFARVVSDSFWHNDYGHKFYNLISQVKDSNIFVRIGFYRGTQPSWDKRVALEIDSNYLYLRGLQYKVVDTIVGILNDSLFKTLKGGGGGGVQLWDSTTTATGFVIHPLDTTWDVTIGTDRAIGNEMFRLRDGAMVIDGTTGATPNVGAFTGILWCPDKWAFRVGNATTTYFNYATLGANSIAMGTNARATASGSIGLGAGATASNTNAIALGTATATGASSIAIGANSSTGNSNAVALGYYAAASGVQSQAYGTRATSQTYRSFAFGDYNIVSGTTGSLVSTDPHFVIGNGTGSGVNSSNIFTQLWNGMLGINARTSADYPLSTLQVNTKNNKYESGYSFNFVDNRTTGNQVISSYAESIDTANWHFGFTDKSRPYTLMINDTGARVFEIDSNAKMYSGDATNFVEFSKDSAVRLYGTATVWDDLRVVPTALASGASAPSSRTFKGNVKQLAYNYQAADDIQHGEAQIPHSYFHGTDISPHIHVALEDSTAAGDSIVWVLEYTWANVDAEFPTTTSDTVTTDISSWATLEHKIISFTDMTGTGMTRSSMVAFRISRLQSHANDTHQGWVFLVAMDFHYQKNKLGTNDEY